MARRGGRTPAGQLRRNPRRSTRRSPVAQAEARLRALHAVAVMRREERSLRAAAAQVHSTPRTIRKYARQALRKRHGRYEVIPLDELRRPMRVLTERGIAVVNIESSRTASRLATYWTVIDRYLRTGDRRALAPFDGRKLRAEGQLFPFITDPRLLDRLAQAGQVSFEELYEPTA